MVNPRVIPQYVHQALAIGLSSPSHNICTRLPCHMAIRLITLTCDKQNPELWYRYTKTNYSVTSGLGTSCEISPSLMPYIIQLMKCQHCFRHLLAISLQQCFAHVRVQNSIVASIVRRNQLNRQSGPLITEYSVAQMQMRIEAVRDYYLSFIISGFLVFKKPC